MSRHRRAKDYGHRAPRKAPPPPPATLLYTQVQAETELGDLLLAHTHFLLQLPREAVKWPVLLGLGAVHFVANADAVVRAVTEEAVRGLAMLCHQRAPLPAIGVVSVPKHRKAALYKLLELDPHDGDDRDILILDAADPGPNPLLEAALRYADTIEGRTPAPIQET